MGVLSVFAGGGCGWCGGGMWVAVCVGGEVAGGGWGIQGGPAYAQDHGGVFAKLHQVWAKSIGALVL